MSGAGFRRRAIIEAAAWSGFMAQNRTRVLAVCASCGSEFNAVASEIKRGKGKCCSLSCAAALAAKNRDQKGAANNNWKGGLADQSNAERKRRYRDKNPEKHRAHLAMRNAIRSGILVRKPCEVCGSNKTEGHHDDYSSPLSVRWLCKKHHLEAHGGKFSHLQAGIKPSPLQ